MTELTKQERVSYASGRLAQASKWMVLSGTATFFLTGLLDVIAQFQMPYWATLLIYLFINTAIYGIAKYVEGESKE